MFFSRITTPICRRRHHSGSKSCIRIRMLPRGFKSRIYAVFKRAYTPFSSPEVEYNTVSCTEPRLNVSDRPPGKCATISYNENSVVSNIYIFWKASVNAYGVEIPACNRRPTATVHRPGLVYWQRHQQDERVYQSITAAAAEWSHAINHHRKTSRIYELKKRYFGDKIRWQHFFTIRQKGVFERVTEDTKSNLNNSE